MTVLGFVWGRDNVALAQARSAYPTADRVFRAPGSPPRVVAVKDDDYRPREIHPRFYR